MLAFVDESGDSGRKPERGSSAFFTVALVTFEEREEALACDRRIEILRRELQKPAGFEFHFRDNSHAVRLRFLGAVAPFGFFYQGFSLDKDPRRLQGPTFGIKESLHGFACRLVFEAAKPYLQGATVVIDESGEGSFMLELRRFLRQRADESGRKLVRKVKMERSRSNNLLQLADYVAGIMNRTVCARRGAQEYRSIIAAHEITRKTWPT